MSALAGVLFRRSETSETVVRRMLSAAPHRGGRHEVATIGLCAVGVANDPEHAEATLASGDGLVVAFTGTLDNADELARRFSPTDGKDPRTPAQVVLLGFQEIGESLVPLLRGDFSVVVATETGLRCFRDQIGFETLFAREAPAAVYVATEAKQVLAGAEVAPDPDLAVIEGMFYGDGQDPAACPLRGVRRVLAGTLYEFDSRAGTTRRYWDPTGLFETAKLSMDETSERFAELFAQAVRRSLTGSDVVALSGGIDSPPVASFGNREHLQLYGTPLHALAEVYPSYPSADETYYIELAAERLGLPLHTYEPGRQQLDRLQYWVRIFDGPWSTVAPEGTSQRCLQARSLGFRTLLTGHFAEHITAAGQRFLVPHLLWHGRFRAAAAQLRSQRSAGVRRSRLARRTLSAAMPRAVERRQLFYQPQLPMPSWIDVGRIARRDARAALPARKRWEAFQLPFFGGTTTGEADPYSHAVHGIRPRRPWADVDLWEFFVSLPAEVKFPDYRMKGLVRNLLRGDVPDEILDRTDKTNTNEYYRGACMDMPAVRRWLTEPRHRLAGIDYAGLARDLERDDMSLAHYLWMRDLAAVHAFLDLWD